MQIPCSCRCKLLELPPAIFLGKSSSAHTVSATFQRHITQTRSTKVRSRNNLIALNTIANNLKFNWLHRQRCLLLKLCEHHVPNWIDKSEFKDSYHMRRIQLSHKTYSEIRASSLNNSLRTVGVNERPIESFCKPHALQQSARYHERRTSPNTECKRWQSNLMIKHC